MAFRELDYQRRALEALDNHVLALSAEKARYDQTLAVIAANPELELSPPHFPAKAWERLAANGRLPPDRAGRPYSERRTGDGQPTPNATLKVPTGGGKTFLACAAVSRIFGGYLKRNTGFVLWITPNEAIYRQTLKALRDRQHPYRETLDRAAAGRVLVLEKTDPLRREDVEANLTVMLLMLQSGNRQNRETLKLFQDRGDVHGFTPPEGDQAAHGALLRAVPNLDAYDLAQAVAPWAMVKDSVGNALRLVRPVVVMDEGQRAVSELAYETLYGFNPSFVLELTATPVDVAPRPARAGRPAIPGRSANILVSIAGRELEREGMIKMPLNLEPRPETDWRVALGAALAKLDDLQGRADRLRAEGGPYIRPILLVQAERTGADQAGAGFIHAEDVKAWLMRAGLDAEEVAFKTAEVNDLDKPENLDLMAPTCRVRAVITKAALAEGWDCPFAYVLCSLAVSGAEGAMTQLVGRILRQPYATKTGVAELDQCYVFTHRAQTAAVVEAIKAGLTADGLGDLVRDIALPTGAAGGPVKRAVPRRPALAASRVALPRVLWIEAGEPPRPVDVEGDLHAAVDWSRCDLAAFAAALPTGGPATEARIIQFRTGELSGFETTALAAGEPAERRDFDLVYATRMVGEIVANGFVAAELVSSVLAGLAARGLGREALGGLCPYIADEMRRHLARWRDDEAARLFAERLEAGKIEFRLRGDGGDWLLPDRVWTLAEPSAKQVTSISGGPLTRSAFLPVYAAELNEAERQVAIYLDDQSAIRWWWRNHVGSEGYGLRGWRRGVVYPDFLFETSADGAADPRIVALETKGDQLEGNLDTAYKRTLLATLTRAFARSPGDAGGQAVNFEAALVLFSEINANLPSLIRPAA